MDSDDNAFYIQIFRDEANTCLNDLRDALRTLYKDPADVIALEQGYRAAHTIKGSAGLLRLSEIAGLAREMEDGLRRAYNGLETIGSDTIGHYARLADQIRQRIP